MSLKYVRRLTSSERQWLSRLAKGRAGRRRPAGWKRERAQALLPCNEGPEGEGWPDATIAAALDVSAQRGPLVPPGRGSRAGSGAGAPAQGAAVQLPGRRGRSAAPAVGPVPAAGRPGAWDVAGHCPARGWRGGLRPASVTKRCAAC